MVTDLETDGADSGDTALSSIDGCDGFDTLMLNTDDLNIDFSTWNTGSNSVFKNIEAIDLGIGGSTDNHNLTNITYSDVVNMTDSDNDLYILGDGSDTVDFTGTGWSNTGPASVDVNGASHIMYTYLNSNDPSVIVYVESGITII